VVLMIGLHYSNLAKNNILSSNHRMSDPSMGNSRVDSLLMMI